MAETAIKTAELTVSSIRLNPEDRLRSSSVPLRICFCLDTKPPQNGLLFSVVTEAWGEPPAPPTECRTIAVTVNCFIVEVTV